VHVVLTRFKSAEVVPTFASCIARLPNLHTLHILHAHTQMMKVLLTGFEPVSFLQIRTLVIPGNCWDVLKRCPKVKRLWSITDDGRRLLQVVGQHCKEMEELRGISTDSKKMMKRESTPSLSQKSCMNVNTDCSHRGGRTQFAHLLHKKRQSRCKTRSFFEEKLLNLVGSSSYRIWVPSRNSIF